MGGPHRHSSWTAAFIVLFALVQIAVPAVLLTELRPAPFGWQMFTRGRRIGTFDVIRSDGSRTRVRVDDYAVQAIPEVPFHAVLPAHLCRVVPGAEAVVVTGATGTSAPEVVTRCR